MDKLEDETEGALFINLSPAQKNELLLSDDESRDKSNWLTDEEVRKKHLQWLKD